MIARSRRAQARLYRSECQIARASGPKVFDPETGDTVQPTRTVYLGVCQFRPAGYVGRDAEAGQREVRFLASVVKLPPDTDVARNDLLTVTASTYDPGLVGRTFRVTDVPGNDWQVAREAMVEEVT